MQSYEAASLSQLAEAVGIRRASVPWAHSLYSLRSKDQSRDEEADPRAVPEPADGGAALSAGFHVDQSLRPGAGARDGRDGSDRAAHPAVFEVYQLK